MGTKRKRQALSCVDCRRRKVKCDRTYPVCERCQKNGNADSCTYVPHTGLEAGLPTPSEASPQQHYTSQPQIAASEEPYVISVIREISPHLEVQGRLPPPLPSVPIAAAATTAPSAMRTMFGRASQIETQTTPAGSRPVKNRHLADTRDTAVSDNIEYNPASDFSKVMVRGKSFSTHYYGPSFAISMLLQFEELSKFVKGLLTHSPSLIGIKEVCAKARSKDKRGEKKSKSSDAANLVNMVPDRVFADKLVEKYLDTFETTYRVLHVPSFRREYEAYWKDPSAAEPKFIVVLLLAMACVYCIVPGGPTGFHGRSSVRREIATGWVKACEDWTDSQSQKHVTLGYFQARVLIFIARAMNCIKIKREWSSSGQLLRSVMAVGMHREPSLLSKSIDVFDQEMRRRLWHTIVELDLLTTIARGMPPTIDSFSWDCQPPRNIDDEDFDENSQTLPPPKNRSAYTRSSFLNIAAESLPLRVEVLGRINSVRLSLDLDAVMQYDSKLRQTVDDLPVGKNKNKASFARTMLTLMIYEFILILHVPFANQTHRANSFYSVASKRDISFKTLRLYSTISEENRLILTDLREDACRACLALSHDMTTSMENDILPNYDQALEYMRVIVDAYETRFNSLGHGFHSFWITLSAYNLLKWKSSTNQPVERFAEQAAERVEKLFSVIIVQQVPMPLPNGEATVETDLAPEVETSASEVPQTIESIQSFDAAFPGFAEMNFFDDPFSDMNYDVSAMWNMDGYNNVLMT